MTALPERQPQSTRGSTPNLDESTSVRKGSKSITPTFNAEARAPSGTSAISGVSNLSSSLPSILPGLAAGETWSAIQDHLYVVLDHGPYQRRVLVCGILSAVALLLQFMLEQLIIRHVDHWCRPPLNHIGLSTDDWKNQSIPVQPDGSFSKCTVYDPPIPGKQDDIRRVVTCDEWDYDITDKKDSIESRWNLVCDRRYLYRIARGAIDLGIVVLAPLSGFVADRVGRKLVTMVCAFTWLIAAIANTVAETYPMFVTSGVLCGAASNATFMVIFIVLYEVTGNTKRWLFAILDTAVAGILVPPFVQFFSELQPSWVLSHGILLVPLAALTAWCCILDESPAWLLATGAIQRAHAAAMYAAAANGVDRLKAEAGFMVIASQMQKIGPGLKLTSVSLSAQDGVCQLITAHRHVVSAFLVRYTISAIYFGLITMEKPSGTGLQLIHVFMLTIYYAAICWAVNNYGHRNVVAHLLILIITVSIAEALTVLFQYGQVQAIVQAGFKAVVPATGSVVLCYTAEVFPTNRRSVGISVSSFFGTCGVLTAMFVMWLSGAHAPLVFDVFAASMAFLCFVAIQWLPEVIIEKPRKYDAQKMSEQERKKALVASLSPPKNNPPLEPNPNSLNELFMPPESLLATTSSITTKSRR